MVNTLLLVWIFPAKEQVYWFMIKIDGAQAIWYPTIYTDIQQLFRNKEKIEPRSVDCSCWERYISKFSFVRVEVSKGVT
jgi:hypothetical protein